MKKIFLYTFALVSVIILNSCGSAKSTAPMDMITATKWRLESLNGQSADVSQFGNQIPFITFTTEQQILGNGGCNSFSGSFNINDEGGINVSQILSTKMACGEVNGEAAFFEALRKANMTKIDNDKLTLMEGVQEILVFRPMTEE